MTKIRLKSIATLLVLSCITQSSNGELLASIDVAANTTTTSYETQWRFSLSIDETTILDSLTFSEWDRGSIFTIDSSNDPDFSSFASYLTNGINDTIVQEYNVGPGISSQYKNLSESDHIEIQSPFISNGVDLQGYNIDFITYELDWSILHTTRSGFSHGKGGTVSIYGSPIPEPSTLLLSGAFGFMIYFVRNRLFM